MKPSRLWRDGKHRFRLGYWGIISDSQITHEDVKSFSITQSILYKKNEINLQVFGSAEVYRDTNI